MPTPPLPNVPDWDQPIVIDGSQPGAFGPGINTPGPTVTEPYFPAGGGGFNLSDFLSQIFGSGGLTGMLTGGLTAAQMHNQSDKYRRLGERAAEMSSPVSQDERLFYQDRLRRMTEDPTGYLESNPEFMATRRLGEQALFNKNAARGLGDAGATTQDQMRFLSDLGSRFLSQERKDLMHAGGFQFDPANAGRFLMEGGKLGLESDKAALAAAMYPLGRGGGAQGGGGGGNDPIGNILRMITGGNPSSAMGIVTQLARQGMPEAINLLRNIAAGPLQRIQMPDGTPSDRMVPNPFENTGIMDDFDWGGFFDDYGIDPNDFWDTGFGSWQTGEDISSFFDF